MARQMSVLVEQSWDAVFSESYRTARDVLTQKLEFEAAKQHAKMRLESANIAGKKSFRSGNLAAEEERLTVNLVDECGSHVGGGHLGGRILETLDRCK